MAADMSITILPCPHCGQQPIDRAIEPHTHALQIGDWKMPDHEGSHVIECECGAGMIDETRAAVAARWNKRFGQAFPTPADVARLVEALDWIDDFIARCNGDDRGACEAVNRVRAALASNTAPELTQAARDVLAERKRQIQVEGWTPEHDDVHTGRKLARAAACYAIADGSFTPGLTPPLAWPWDHSWFKPRDARSNYVRAGALILAEIERLDRAAQKGGAA